MIWRLLSTTAKTGFKWTNKWPGACVQCPHCKKQFFAFVEVTVGKPRCYKTIIKKVVEDGETGADRQ